MINLILDEERAKVLQYMINASGYQTNFLETLKEENLMDCFMSLLEDWVEKIHEQGWCVDEHCDYEAKKNKE